MIQITSYSSAQSLVHTYDQSVTMLVRGCVARNVENVP